MEAHEQQPEGGRSSLVWSRLVTESGPLPSRFRDRPSARRPPAALTEGPATVPGLRRNALYRRGLAAADIAAASVAVLAVLPLLGADIVEAWVLVALPLIVLVSKVVGLYDRDADLVHHTTLDEAPALFHMATLYSLLFWLSEGVVVDASLTQSQLLALWGSLFVATLCARWAARTLVRLASPPERCVVLGDASAADRVRRKLADCPSVSAQVVGRMSLQPGDEAGDRAGLLGGIGELADTLTEQQIERVIIAPTSADMEDLLDAIRLVKAMGVKVSVLPRLFEAVGSSARFDDVDGLMLMGIPSYGLTNSSRVLKRSMDVVGSALGLVLLAPVLLGIALLVKLTSRGPVFFCQARIGREGRRFHMWKFRTMVYDADHRKDELLELNEADGLFKIADDPRLTRFGRMLRRFSLDELPQLWNVLRGEMSLVGPRPLVPEEDRQVGGWQRRRLEVTPGITGIWQVLGSARIPLTEMVKIDYLYVANWSLWLDVKTLLRTVLFVIHRRGI